MDKNKTIENINKIKDIINNINNLFSDVDKEIVNLDEKFKDLKKTDSNKNAIDLYNANKDNFKNFLNKLNSKVVDIEKKLDDKNTAKGDKDLQIIDEEIEKAKGKNEKVESNKEGK